MRKHRKKPSRTRRHRESVAAKRRARAFYKARIKREDEIKSTAGDRIWYISALFAVTVILVATAAWILS